MTSSEAGYTLVETVVAMALLALVVGVTSVAYLFGARQVELWRERLALTNTIHTVSQQIATDLRRSDGWSPNGDSVLVLQESAAGTITYAMRDHVLYRNGHPMHGGDVRAMPLRVAEGEGRRLEVALGMAGRTGPVEAILTSARRAPRSWEPTPLSP